jgi:hypothetical protein
MNRIRRALAMLALSLSLVAATATLAAAASLPTTRIEDQNDRLLHHLQAAQAQRTQAAVQLARSMERDSTPTADLSSSAPAEDQNDRLLRNLEAAQAERTRAAVQLARSMERNLTPVPAAGAAVAQPLVRPLPAAPGEPVNVIGVVLLGLFGGLLGGTGAIAGWTAASRRRTHRAVAAM